MKIKFGLLSFLMLIMFLYGESRTNSVGASQEKVTVKVFPDNKRQIIRSIGGN